LHLRSGEGHINFAKSVRNTQTASQPCIFAFPSPGRLFAPESRNPGRTGFRRESPVGRKTSDFMEDPVNDNTPKGGFVFIIIGKAYLDGDNEGIDIHIMLRAPDDDTAVREALNALTEEGFSEADLDQIGTLMGAPDEEPHASAYQGALEGEVAIIRFG
jgi:hypothetical protein